MFQDEEAALGMMAEAAQSGHLLAMWNLAVMQVRGRGACWPCGTRSANGPCRQSLSSLTLPLSGATFACVGATTGVGVRQARRCRDMRTIGGGPLLPTLLSVSNSEFSIFYIGPSPTLPLSPRNWACPRQTPRPVLCLQVQHAASAELAGQARSVKVEAVPSNELMGARRFASAGAGDGASNACDVATRLMEQVAQRGPWARDAMVSDQRGSDPTQSTRHAPRVAVRHRQVRPGLRQAVFRRALGTIWRMGTTRGLY